VQEISETCKKTLLEGGSLVSDFRISLFCITLVLSDSTSFLVGLRTSCTQFVQVFNEIFWIIKKSGVDKIYSSSVLLLHFYS
jgi:hypothetical protein